MLPNKVTRLNKITGNNVNVDLNALFYALRNASSSQTATQAYTKEEIEELCPFLGLGLPEMAKKCKG